MATRNIAHPLSPPLRRPADGFNPLYVSPHFRCFADLKTEDPRCPIQTCSLPCCTRSTENQLALEAAILELTNWVEARGSADVADNVRSALDAIDKNEEFIKLTLAVLMAPE